MYGLFKLNTQHDLLRCALLLVDCVGHYGNDPVASCVL